jgi:hypothetical protein
MPVVDTVPLVVVPSVPVVVTVPLVTTLPTVVAFDALLLGLVVTVPSAPDVTIDEAPPPEFVAVVPLTADVFAPPALVPD